MKRRNTVLFKVIGVMITASLFSFACGPLYPSVSKQELRSASKPRTDVPQPLEGAHNKSCDSDSETDTTLDLISIVLMGETARKWLNEYSINFVVSPQQLKDSLNFQDIRKQHETLLQQLPQELQIQLQTFLSEFPAETAWTQSIQETLEKLVLTSKDAMLYLELFEDQ